MCDSSLSCICVDGATGAHCEIFPRCGDGVIQYPEQCDDGNADNADGCANECRIVASCTRTDCSLGGTIQPQMTEGEVPVDRAFDKFGFGSAIARTETFLFVGHRQDGSGSVTVYRNADAGDELLPVQVLTPSGLGLSNEPTTGFGASISASERYLIIGSPDEGFETEAVGGSTIDGAGAVYVYEYQESTASWAFQARLFSDAPQSNARFGKAVSLYDDDQRAYFVAGAPRYNISGDGINQGGTIPDDIFNAGQVLVFEEVDNNDDGWVKVSDFVGPSAAQGAKFGFSVAATSDHFLVGAPFWVPQDDFFSPTQLGGVAVYSRTEGGDGTFTYAYSGELTNPTTDNGARFGYAVATNGLYDVVGMPFGGEGADPSSPGGVVAYLPGDADPAGEIYTVIPGESGQDEVGRFGTSLALYKNQIAVGDSGTEFLSPSVTVWQLNNDGRAVSFMSKLRVEYQRRNVGFGDAVATDGDNVFIGIPELEQDARRGRVVYHTLETPFLCLTNGDCACHEGAVGSLCNERTMVGDGFLQASESCDDGNVQGGDGCSASGEIETGYECSDSSPSLCTPICGDGLIRGDEECDDPYGPAGSCSDTCTVEWATFPDNTNAEMMKTEVTVQQYRRCVNAGLCEQPTIRTFQNGCNYTAEPGVREFHPVNCLSTEGVANYEAYTGFSIPAAVHWGLNCSGGSSDLEQVFPWSWQGELGDDDQGVCGLANSFASFGCPGETTRVCAFEAGNTVSGLCDMAGNVAEMTLLGPGETYSWRGGHYFTTADEHLNCASDEVSFGPDSPKFGMRLIRGVP